MKNTSTKQVVSFIRNNLYGIKVGVKRDGSDTIVARQSYFYHNGNTKELFGEKLIKEITAAGHKVKLIKTEDQFKQWPGTSYLVAHFTTIND